jgi:hypothetical protein
MPSKWVTRERPKIDRIACPWLIRRFVAKDAEFIYVPTEQVFAVAKATGATPYGLPDAEPFSHHGEQSSFDAFLDHQQLHEHALDRLAVVVHGADTAWRHGDAATLATKLHDALATSHTPLAAPGASTAAKPDLAIEQLLGRKDNAVGGVLQFGIPRGDAIEDAGMAAPPATGTATAVNLQPTGGGKAAITGDFVLEAKEVEPVLAALRGAGIEVTALHNHMLNDQPRTFFVHF